MTRRSKMEFYAPFLAALLSAGVVSCSGKKKLQRSNSAPAGDESIETKDDGGISQPDDPKDPVIPGSETGTKAFTPARQEVRALPYRLRIRKLAYVVGKPVEDPVFDTMHAARVELGDYSHMNNLGGSMAWSAPQIEAWVRHVEAICASPLMRSRYPGQTGAVALMEAAYGRSIPEVERASVAGWLTTTEIDPVRAEILVCTAVLSSSEFVGR